MKKPEAEKEGPVAAELVVQCSDIDESIEFYTRELSFRLESIFPADNPRIAVLSGAGMLIRLELAGEEIRREKVSIRIPGRRNVRIASPEGIAIDFVEPQQAIETREPKPELSVTNIAPGSGWAAGRAGMKYRDLIPNRLGGYMIASHIRIENEGPVADYVHFHDIEFQIIFCLKGWARLVYEDQGVPFVFEPGDCVLQPPGIRHRVLETSGGFEVVEVSSPAEHITYADHVLELPNKEVNRERSFEGQRFAWSRASETRWQNDAVEGIEIRDTGILEAGAGAVGVRVLRATKTGVLKIERRLNRMTFWHVIAGGFSLVCGERMFAVSEGSSAIIPANTELELNGISEALSILEVVTGQVHTHHKIRS
ncbi:MAG: cupin domain-containing protein [Acidobacteriota bacterium]|nr:cupin domain-containing protein [Acidobacteriota bacterium]MDH3530805.1 cupin domain-containing protein [Acidobacteriota bacterium]